MAGNVVVSLIGLLLLLSIGVIVINNLIYIFAEGGFGGFLAFGFDKISELFGTTYGAAFSSLVIAILLIFFFRFAISWLTEDSGGSANN